MDWQDLHVAYAVSQAGTVSGAAQILGVHHATVIRHVDRLEEELGQKLFRRHSKGYEPTDAGQSLFNVAAVADEQFLQAQARIEGREQEMSGKIVITTLPAIAGVLMPAFSLFQKRYPDVKVRVETSNRLYRLEYGEAHLAIRAGSKPADPDNVAISLRTMPATLYASRAYVERFGEFDPENSDHHRFVASFEGEERNPYNQWLDETGYIRQVAFDSDDPRLVIEAVRAGYGMGLLFGEDADRDEDLFPQLPRDLWMINIWQVTHRDMHRSAKVQAMSECLKETLKG